MKMLQIAQKIYTNIHFISFYSQSLVNSLTIFFDGLVKESRYAEFYLST